MKRRRFKHLTWNDRLKIEAFLKCGKAVQEIADEIGVHRNTITMRSSGADTPTKIQTGPRKNDTARKLHTPPTRNTWPRKDLA